VRAPVKLFLASSNPGKLAEFRVLAAGGRNSAAVELELLPDLAAFPAFEENAPTFAENALGKALYYSRLKPGLVFADDSGLVVPALGGAPGVHSARYAGATATSEQRIEKLLHELRKIKGAGRSAYFVCAIAVAEQGRAKAIVTDHVDGEILSEQRGSGGFGYDPVFYFPELNKSFAELSPEEKNLRSHRGKAFRKVIGLVETFQELRKEENAEET
jgi:XTP/dITP diphosphohydrolase